MQKILRKKTQNKTEKNFLTRKSLRIVHQRFDDGSWKERTCILAARHIQRWFILWSSVCKLKILKRKGSGPNSIGSKDTAVEKQTMSINNDPDAHFWCYIFHYHFRLAISNQPDKSWHGSAPPTVWNFWPPCGNRPTGQNVCILVQFVSKIDWIYIVIFRNTQFTCFWAKYWW